MNSLAISLQRLGDLIMHAHVINTWSASKSVNLTLLTHPFFHQIDFLFPSIRNVLLFNREGCQKSMGEPHLNKDWPHVHINKILSNLNGLTLSTAIDLAHTETSQRWLTLINAHKKIGVGYNELKDNKQFLSNCPYVSYLHSHSFSKYHFIDLFKKSLNLTLGPLPPAANFKSREKLLLLQMHTSDPKKAWPLAYWKELLLRLSSEFNDFQMGVLVSPMDFEKLRDELGTLPSRCSILCSSMQEAFHLLKSACLLITLDTAIKHLATWSQTPIIEIATGSSVFSETGAYQQDAWILSPTVPCHPCKHSSHCSEPHFFCQTSITPNHVMEATNQRLGRESTRPSLHANRMSNDTFKIVTQSPDGWWTTRPLHLPSEVNYGRRNKESFEIGQ